MELKYLIYGLVDPRTRLIRYVPIPRWRLPFYLAWMRLTAPFRRRDIVRAVDRETGTITVDEDVRWWRFL